jgi:hypothetical protein
MDRQKASKGGQGQRGRDRALTAHGYIHGNPPENNVFEAAWDLN